MKTQKLINAGHGEIHDQNGLLVARVPFGQAKRVFAEHEGKEHLKDEFQRTEKEAKIYLNDIVLSYNMHAELLAVLNGLKSLVETTRLNDEFKKSVSNENKNMMSAYLLQANKLLQKAVQK